MFRDSNDPSKVNIIANYIGLEDPASGPNFVRFGDDVLYEIHVDNNGDVQDDITFQFRFRTTVANPNTFLYNTFTIDPNTYANQNVKQTYSVRMIKNGQATTLATNVPDAAGEHRPPLDAELLAATRPRRSSRCRVAARCSPGSATTRSSSTSARCSTCSACGRSTAPTSPRCRPPNGVDSLRHQERARDRPAAPDRDAHQERQRADHGGRARRRSSAPTPRAAASGSRPCRPPVAHPATRASGCRSAGSASRSSTRC